MLSDGDSINTQCAMLSGVASPQRWIAGAILTRSCWFERLELPPPVGRPPGVCFWTSLKTVGVSLVRRANRPTRRPPD